MRNNILLVVVLIWLSACKKDAAPVSQVQPVSTFINGADLSSLPEIEQAGTVFYTPDSIATDVVTYLHQNGCNTVRLRLWYNSTSGHCTLSEVSMFAQQLRLKGMKIWLDIHYSDTWADPSQQATPQAWNGVALPSLRDSIYNYTKRCLSIIQPDYVQIGNEINNGFLFPTGNISNDSAFIQLLKAGIKAARDNNKNTKIIIHYAGINGADWFFNNLKSSAVDYDIIGLSYYPIWHGKDLDSLQTTLSSLAGKYNKQVVIAETAYPFNLGWNDMTNNVVGLSSQLNPNYSATPAGQKDFILKIKNIVQSTPNGTGFCYWGGELVAFEGYNSTDGSSWENQALFDFNNKGLPVIEDFKQ